MAEDEQKEKKHGSPVWWPGWLLVSILVLSSMMYVYYRYPHQNIGPKQPIPFSHRIHAGVKRINCLFCHPYAERGPRAGIPVMEKCFFCHKYVIPWHPEIEKERAHYESGDPVAWVRIFYIPDHVKFRHQPHIRWAGLACTTCHGQVQTEDRLQKKYFKMGFCIGCHRKMNAQLDCWLSCHH